MPKNCYNCNHEWTNKFSPGFREECPECDQPLHCCKNCRFYDGQAYQWCTEPQARIERPRDPETSNLCDYFLFRENKSPADYTQVQAKEKLNKLFEKNPDNVIESSTQDNKPEWMKFDRPD